jgi:hypothetical protein
MLKTLCNQDKPGKNEKDRFFSESFHYNKNPECDKKRTTPYKNVPKQLN